MEKQVVPKFNSYRSSTSKSVVAKDQDGTSRNEPVGQRRRHSRHRHGSRPEKSVKKERDLKSEEKVQDEASPERIQIPELAPWNSSPSEQDHSIFVVDRRGDPSNTAYGSADKYKIPLYHDSTSKAILGDTSSRVPRGSSRPLQKLGRDDRNALFSHPQRLAGQDGSWAIADDFLPFQHSKRRKLNDLDVIEGGHSSDVARESPRESDSSRSDSSDTQNSPEENGTDAATLYDIKTRHEKLQNTVRDHPHSGRAWLDLIEFQDLWLHAEHAHTSEANPTHAEGIASVKLSMYEKARTSVPPEDADREAILLGCMEETINTQAAAKALAYCNDILEGLKIEIRPYSSVWIRFFSLVQTTFDLCDHEAILATEHQSRQIMLTRHKNREIPSIHYILRYTSCLREFGYQEQALAVWQGLLEIKFFTPSDLRSTSAAVAASDQSDTILEAFSEFWDKDVARIGEEHAPGWSNSTADTTVDSSQVTFQPTIPKDPSSFFEWSQLERTCVASLWRPGRASVDTDIEDPYHIVFAADVANFVQTAIFLPAADLIDAFLSFCGLPGLPSDTGSLPVWRRDEMLSQNGTKLLSGDTFSSDQLLKKTTNHQTSTQTLFAKSSEIFSSFRPFNATGYPDFVVNALELLVTALPQFDDLAEYYLGFLLFLAPERARKKAKALLKTRPTCIRLYSAFALIEARSMKLEAADRTFDTALRMTASLSVSEQKQSVVLLQSWVWEAIGLKDYSTAKKRLVSYNQNYFHTTDQLSDTPQAAQQTSNAKAILTEALLGAIADESPKQVAIYIELLALLSYLNFPPNLLEALDVFEKYLKLYDTGSLNQASNTGLVHQARAQLIQHHISASHPYRPAAVRETLKTSIDRFPSNTIFLAMYAQNESRSRLDDRVRALTREALLTTDSMRHQPPTRTPSLMTWITALRTELARGETLGSTAHSIRSTFERAISSPSGRHAVEIWAAYVAFEHSIFHAANESDKSSKNTAEGPLPKTRTPSLAVHEAARRVKGVFFRGMHALPWVKMFAMLAFDRLGEVMDETDLQRVHGTMVEKGMRMYLEFDGAAAQA